MADGRRRGRLLAAGLALGVVARAVETWRLRRRTPREADLRTDDGVSLHTEAGGARGTGLTVVLVHGFAGRLDEFRAQRGVLGSQARVVAYDHRGHGRSGWAGRGSATLARLGHDLAEVVERRTSGPVVLVGHSMGGMAIMALAAQRPDLVASRVVGTALLSTSAGDLARAVLPPYVDDVLLRTPLARVLALGDWFLAPVLDRLGVARWTTVRRRLHRQMFGERPPTRDQRRLVESMWAGTRRSVTAALLPALAEHSRRHALGALGGRPSLVLTGTADRTIPPHHSRVIAEELGDDARLVEVEGAGHMVNLTHADVVNGELLRLLERVRERVARV